jgi:uncharacterized protein YggU (UPF0235/DUF167 family)
VAFDGRTLLVDVAAPPIENRANEELVRTLAESIEIAKTRIHIVKGQGARSKLVEFELDPRTLERWLAAKIATVPPDY